MSSKKFPISRLSKFYDYVDFNLENEMAETRWLQQQHIEDLR